MSDLTPEQEAARDRVHDLLAELAGILGPGSYDELDEDEAPAGQVFLNGWVMVLAWIDEDGESFLTRGGSAHLPAYQRNGLLHEGLYGFD